ncbi:S-layer domain-containing protein [uncultured Sporomusa sp.]|uniref:S-layer domain-containing protein n=1 Tax=uncultured Sporomusa sp. TaxID=307249 RepID=A0A212M1A9_9FIRM|nr:S-layer homology domain-containing protein [uncultured Sporomusa sp.]SCM83604.1 S-layer domain-containing protein [uncultured Sporomusa sp.]
MKRQTAMALAAVFAMSVAGTALAAPVNPFVDVPAKHWSYDAVTKLAQAGVVSGYGDGTYKGDRTLTRYEMATIVAKAMANSEKADAETQKTIDALAAEYGAELNNLGVRVDNLEKKVGNVKFSGEIRARYEHGELKALGVKESDMGQTMRARLNVNAQINEDWAFTGRFSSEEDIRESGRNSDTDLDHLYLTGKLGAFDLTVGRFDAVPAYGIALDDVVEGAMVSFGNKLRVDLFAGKQEYTEILSNSQKDELYIANLGYAFSDKLNAKGAYFHVKPEGSEKIKLYEVGLDYQFNPNVNLSGVYLKSDLDVEDQGFFTQLSYKGSDVDNKGSFGAWVNYRDLELGTVLSSTLDTGVVSVNDVSLGGKGYEIGFDYVLKKNILWTTSYTDLESTVSKNIKGEFIRSEIEFFF